MKKVYLLIVAAMLCCLPTMAIGRGDGSTKANAIEFDWENGSVQEASASAVWYRVSLDPVYQEETPTLAIFLTNLTDNTANVHIQGTLAGQTEKRDYVLSGKEYRVWTAAGGMLIQMKQKEVYLCLTTDQRIAVTSKVYATSDIDEACLTATEFNWTAGVSQTAESVWYKVDLRAAKAAAGKEIAVRVRNTGAAAATVTAGVSFDCPSTGVTSNGAYLAAGQTYTKTISRSVLDMLAADEVYVRVDTKQPVQITAQLVDADIPATPVFDGSAAIEALLNTTYNIGAGEYIYKVKLASLREKGMVPELTVINKGAARATVKAEVAFVANPYSVTVRTIQLAPDASATKTIEPNMLEGLSAEYVYVRVTADQPISFAGRLRRLHEGEACKTSVDFAWNTEHRQSANTTVWYAVDIKEAKADKKDILLHVKNMGNKTASIKGSIAFECPYSDLQTVSRTLAAQTQNDKTLSWNTFGMMASDTVYVGVETDQNILFSASLTDMPAKEADDACLRATAFDWTYGHKQAAKDTVWYKVGLADVRNTTLVPTLTINNLGAANALIEAEMSLECPDNVANTQRTMSLAAAGKYEKTFGRDFVNGIDKTIDTLYFRVISSQPIAFYVKMSKEDEGSSCRSAVLFNWISGNDQKADAALWYMVDLRAAKQGNKDIRVSITNKANAAAAVEAQVAFTCPCDVPQTQTATLRGLQTQSTTIAHSTLETLGDTVYVRLSSSQAVHVEAELIDPEPFATIDCPENMVSFAWGQHYTTTADTTWYYVSKTVLDEMMASAKTPRIYLTSAAKQTVTAKVAYHCPVTETMQSKSVSVGAGQELYKLLERGTAEQLVAKHDSIMVMLIGNGLQFHVDLVDPNTGEDCLHAVNYTVGDTCIQDETITRWYRLDKKAVVALDKLITFSLENLSTAAGTLQAGLYTSCDSAAIMAEQVSLGVGQKRSKEFSSDIFSAFGSDYLYMKITTRAAQQVRITSSVRDYAVVEPVTACAEAIEAVPNATYNVEANVPTWYAVDIRNLKENTIGNGTLTIRNLDNSPVVAKAEISWVCPVEHEMTYRQQTIAGGEALVYTVERTQFNAFDSARVYVRVSADRKISFRFDITLSKGDDCLNAIDFDWINGNVHPGSTEQEKTNCLWYQVLLDSTSIPEGYDMQLSIVNLDKQQPTETSARIMWECDSEIKSLERTITAGDTIRQTIDRDVIKQAGWPNLQILYCSDKTTKIFADFVPEAERVQGFDTIYATVCDGSAYIDSIFVGDKWYYINMTVFDDDAASQQLDTVISWRDGASMRDSVLTYKVTPLVAAKQIPASQLQTLQAMPLLVEGMSLFVEPSLNALRRYYSSVDTIAKIDTIYWSDNAAGNTWADTTAILPKDIHTKTLYLHIEDSCENALTYPYTFMVAPWRTDSVVLYDTVCPNTASQLLPGTVIHQDTVIRVTKQLILPDTLGRPRTMDLVYVYTLKVKTAPVLSTVLPYQPTVACGKSIATTRATTSLLRQFSQDKSETDMAVESVAWQRKDTLNGTYSDLTADRLGKDEKKVVLRYVAVTECGNSLFSQDFDFVPKAYVYKVAPEVQDNVCPGSEYTGRLGAHIILNDTTWNDTLTIRDTDMDFDSVYVYNITTLRLLKDTIERDTICESDMYPWHGLQITETGVYHDTVYYESGCEKERYTLYLTVLSATDMPQETATIKEGQNYVWHTWRDRTLTEAGTYYDTAYYATGCDSVHYTLVLTVTPKPTEELTITDTVCAGSEYISRMQTLTIRKDTAWTEKVTVNNAETGDVDSLYHYQLYVYRFFMPAIAQDDVLAVCGQTVDTTRATAAVQQAVVAEPLFAPNTAIRWFLLQGDAWKGVADKALDGQMTEVTVRCEISSDCATKDTTLVIAVEQPDADNDAALRNLPAKSMYSDRLLMINLNGIREQFPDWNITEADVHWYKMVGENPDVNADTEVATGFYYTTENADALVGTYYARIVHAASSESDCAAEARTVILTCANSTKAPQLRPNVVLPEEQIQVVNLNPDMETDIVVYTSTGQKVAAYTSREAETFLMNAASDTGYYMVDIQCDGEKITLRYVVK